MDTNLKSLIKLNSIYEFNMVRGLLESNDIPYVLKEYGSANYMRIITGGGVFNGEIFVDGDDYDRVKDLLEIIGE